MEEVYLLHFITYTHLRITQFQILKYLKLKYLNILIQIGNLQNLTIFKKNLGNYYFNFHYQSQFEF